MSTQFRCSRSFRYHYRTAAESSMVSTRQGDVVDIFRFEHNDDLSIRAVDNSCCTDHTNIVHHQAQQSCPDPLQGLMMDSELWHLHDPITVSSVINIYIVPHRITHCDETDYRITSNNPNVSTIKLAVCSVFSPLRFRISFSMIYTKIVIISSKSRPVCASKDSSMSGTSRSLSRSVSFSRFWR